MLFSCLQRFVSERGVDQSIGTADRFTLDMKDATQQICSFGCGKYCFHTLIYFLSGNLLITIASCYISISGLL